ncbi:glycoside hydrolase family 65 protein [Lentilactobacillus buchneri]|uniref:glycoside hydrolase family 65 protein n=1 Tax=Lentilactobacillus buchneri TaxID=1581 RepID=UPI0021A577BA|nr:glycosyl hydrolase family 65 protein [Lentilactobacillus buchneri]MCT3553247.1 glycoside hydrolase family 65 protein [Lentilactobacillus buchneri]
MRIEQSPEFQIHLQTLRSKEELFLETIYNVGNGHFGVRDSNPLQGNNHDYIGSPGLFINGFFDYEEVAYGEKYRGYPDNNQVINRLFDPRFIRIKVGNEDSLTDHFKVENIDKNLDMQTGLLHELFSVTTPGNRNFNLVVESFASLSKLNVYGVRYSVIPTNFSDEIEVIKVHDYVNQTVHQQDEDVRVSTDLGQMQLDFIPDNGQPSYLVTTFRSQQGAIITYQASENFAPNPPIEYFRDDNHHYGYRSKYYAKPGSAKDFEFLFAIGDIHPLVNANMYSDQYLSSLNNYINDTTFKSELMASAQVWQTFWLHSDVEIDGDPALQLCVRFNLFELNQSAGRDALTSIPAKGLTGNGYGGHFFWDTEIFMLPFFTYTQPEVAKDLLMFRCHTLQIAKEQASDFGLGKGAMYPWRTINGYESSAYWLAGQAQFHINADIAFAVEQYYEITSDDDFIRDYGFEIILETARFWMEYGNYAELDGKRQFVLNRVTGPDEYSALVDNNYYTNVLAQSNLRLAVKYVRKFKGDDGILSRLHVTDDEIDAMEKAANAMYLPYDKEKNVKLQFQNFEQLPKMDISAIDQSMFPLLLHYHPLMLYRHQVNKQADTIMVDFMFPEGNTLDQLKADYEFYEPITTHDSSLSKAIYAIIAARIGKDQQAYNFFSQAVQTDLMDVHHNTKNGIHAGSLGAAWEGIMYGFAGIVNNATSFSLEPHLPSTWNCLKFKVHLYGNEFKFTIYQDSVEVELLSGEGTDITVYSHRKHLTPDNNRETWQY